LIEIVETANGQKAIRFNGRLLASRFNPRQEAREWLARRTEFLTKVRTIIVLGMASGHHIAELVEATQARILVIDTNEEILAAGQAIHSFPADRVIVEHVRNSRDLRSSVQVKKAVAESFIVLVHPVAALLDGKVFEDCRTQLLGRDWGALTWQWKLRNGPSFDINSRIDGVSLNPLTIYDLEQTELVQNSEEREKLLFRALRELVK
jgi:hypothetical protein